MSPNTVSFFNDEFFSFLVQLASQISFFFNSTCGIGFSVLEASFDSTCGIKPGGGSIGF
jgi:hypothetical protein